VLLKITPLNIFQIPVPFVVGWLKLDGDLEYIFLVVHISKTTLFGPAINALSQFPMPIDKKHQNQVRTAAGLPYAAFLKVRSSDEMEMVTVMMSSDGQIEFNEQQANRASFR